MPSDDAGAAADLWDLIGAGAGPDRERVSDLVNGHEIRLGREGLARARESLSMQVLGAGPLQHLLDQPGVTDVLVNGPDQIWVDRGQGLLRERGDLGDAESVRRLAVRLAGLAGRRLDDASPFVDGLLPGGVRLHAILPPLVDGGAHISLRVPRRHAPSLADLVDWGAMPASFVPVLDALMSSRTSFLVTGGTGAGKTTVLAGLLARVAVTERVVVVEEVAELAVDHPHVVRLQSRPPNVEGRGAVGLEVLVRQCLRMRPDRIVVGEVRGGEVRDLLAALNTGHDGGCGTVHANGTADVVARVEALGALAGMPPEATRVQLASAVRVIVHLRRRGRRRYVEDLAVLVPGQGDAIAVLSALSYRPFGTAGSPHPDVERGPGWPQLARWLGLPEEDR